ncbi:GNAT family N-acetyltransferase [Desulfocurvibacter africanus]|uniref:GNAT family N-acetyltransferase n=1 Tax=Desulfocurvibacter africanus TaxID=873 RepID=UPI001FCBD883|nr:GNAT family N-acetyltransferase [Desulfocurvibacter africanus]
MASFQSGEPALDEWLRRRALANQRSGASRTYVVTDNVRVAGYYALAVGAVVAAEAPGKVRRNMPDIIPVMVLGRLAVDQTFQGRGLGLDLLRDAVLRTLQAADIAGIRALLVHALHEKAAGFYARAGFQPSPLRPLTCMLLLADARKALGLM